MKKIIDVSELNRGSSVLYRRMVYHAVIIASGKADNVC